MCNSQRIEFPDRLGLNTGGKPLKKVLITARSFSRNSEKPANRLLNEYGYQVDFYPRGQLSAEDMRGIVDGYDALIIGIDQVDRSVIDSGKNLKVVCMHGTGTDHIDVDYASEKGIYVGNVPGGNTNAVAELAAGLMIDAARQVSYSAGEARSGKWVRRVGRELSGKTLGLIGFGFIGRRMVKLLSGFEMNVLAYDLQKDHTAAESLGVRYVELDELFSAADFISLHAPLTPKTRYMLDKNAFDKMKDGVVIVNTARGALIEEKALCDALESGKVAAAGLDAVEIEPLPADSPLRKHDNVVITAHIAASTMEAADTVDFVNAQTVVSILENQCPVSVVNVAK
jgi:D-3-phosphoglycerate dehydrogenase